MKINVHQFERVFRIVFGLCLVVLAFLTIIPWWIGLVGLIPIFTGLIGNCPLYSLLGFSTCKIKQSN